MSWLFWGKNKRDRLIKQETAFDINNEVDHSYKALCNISSEEIASVISTITKVHSERYIADLLATAALKDNFQLAELISTQQEKDKNDNKLKKIELLHSRFSNLFDSLYWCKYKWHVYEIRQEFEKLKEDCIYAKEFSTAEKCENVLQDIGKRGNNMLYEIRRAHLLGKPWRKKLS